MVSPLLLSRVLPVVLVLVALAVAPASAPAKINGFVGITADDVFRGSTEYRDANFAQQKSVGIDYIRQNFHWPSIETRARRWRLVDYDAFVLAAARQGIRVFPTIISTPRFYSARARRGARRVDACPPRDMRNIARFASVLVNRYGSRGTLWRQNPTVRPLPIKAWQIWNEPNLPAYWCNGPSGKSYTAMLRAVYPAIKRSDRGAAVVTAGIPDPDTRRLRGSIRFARFVGDMYRNRAASVFDVLAVNSFGKRVSAVFRELATARSLMRRSRDARTKIWLTELGWATGGPRSPSRISQREQAARINGSFRALARQRGSRSLNLAGVVYYSWRDDNRPLCRGCRDYSGRYTGLFDMRGNPKIAFRNFRITVLGLR